MAQIMNREYTYKYVASKLREVADALENGDAWILEHEFKHEYDSGLIEDLHIRISKNRAEESK